MAKKKSAKSGAAKQVVYLRDESPVAQRQAKTDLLVLARLLRDEGTKQFQDEDHVAAAHAVLVRWADLESSGRLDKVKETQLQGLFLNEVFGDALGYAPLVEGAEVFYQLQHEPIGPNQTPDAVLGKFRQDEPRAPLAVVELKGPAVHLDRDRSQGRTAVDQCWDYLVNTPATCRWGVVSNIVSFRLYERDSTKRAYEHFTLQELRDAAAFRRFYALMHRNGLVEGVARELPRAVRLLRATNERQREVSDALYESYSHQRLELIAHLHHKLGHALDAAVEMAQRLLDRIIFIAFCEDRSLLPERTIPKAYAVNGFSAAQNPRWESFKALFRFIDVGHPKANIPRYNGGLFAKHEVDDLDLSDDWTEFFKNVSEFDFRDEVNLDVLGHLFERSITELERLKETGLLTGDREKQDRYAAMPQSVKRKQLGIYYTPPELTLRIVRYTVEELIEERFAAAAVRHGVKKSEAQRGAVPDTPEFWRECLAILRDLKIVDPACGSGAFLFQAYNALELRYHEVIGHIERFNSPPSQGGARGGSPDRGSDSDSDARGDAAVGNPSPGPSLPGRGGGEQSSAELAAQIPHFILNDNLYGVDLSAEAVEITQLALWIRSATAGQTLATLSRNIVHGNSLVHDAGVHADGFDWRKRFPEVFERGAQPTNMNAPAPSPSEGRAGEGGSRAGSVGGGGGKPGSSPLPNPPLQGEGTGKKRKGNPPPQGEGTGGESAGGFDCVIGNPPWERIKLQEREFFSLPRPDIATATNAAKRRQLVAALEAEDPPLYERYQQAQAGADALLTYCRRSEAYPLTGRGDINLYAVFAELAYRIVAPAGRVGLLTPSGIASDMTTKDFFQAIAETDRLIRLYDFHNRKQLFKEVEGRLKFCILNFGGAATQSTSADFIFFAEDVDDLEDQKRHVALSSSDIRLLNPNTRTCPVFKSTTDAEVTKAIYRRVPILIDLSRKGPTGNPWGVSFKRMIDQTNDAELFREAAFFKEEGFELVGNVWKKGDQTYSPLYEAKMCRPYDHRHGTIYIKDGNWYMQGRTELTSLAGHQNPEELVFPRYWGDQQEIDARLGAWNLPFLLAFRDIVRPTDERTLIAHFLPRVGAINTIPLLMLDSALSARRMTCFIGNLNSFALDYVSRQKISQVHMNFFIVEQLPVLSPDTYDRKCPWDRQTTLEAWISERVLKLTCTAEDMLPLAEACDFSAGSFQQEYGGRLNKWDPDERGQLMAELDPDERGQLMAELDAAYFLLYGLDRDDAEYVLSTFKGIHDANDLFAGHVSVAERILAVYEELAGGGGK